MKLSFKRPYLDAEETNKENFGSGCGSVGRAVASNSRGPRFKSSHQQTFILNTYCQLYFKDENKEIEAENGPFCKKTRKTVEYCGLILVAVERCLNNFTIFRGVWLRRQELFGCKIHALFHSKQ